jgi:hypothetical protein
MAGSWSVWVAAYWHAAHVSRWFAQRAPERWNQELPEFRDAVTGVITAGIQLVAAQGGIHLCQTPADLIGVSVEEVERDHLTPSALRTDFSTDQVYWPPEGPLNPGGGAPWRYVEDLLWTDNADQLQHLVVTARDALVCVVASCRGTKSDDEVTLRDLLDLWPPGGLYVDCSLREYAAEAASS